MQEADLSRGCGEAGGACEQGEGRCSDTQNWRPKPRLGEGPQSASGSQQAKLLLISDPLAGCHKEFVG